MPLQSSEIDGHFWRAGFPIYEILLQGVSEHLLLEFFPPCQGTCVLQMPPPHHQHRLWSPWGSLFSHTCNQQRLWEQVRNVFKERKIFKNNLQRCSNVDIIFTEPDSYAWGCWCLLNPLKKTPAGCRQSSTSHCKNLLRRKPIQWWLYFDKRILEICQVASSSPIHPVPYQYCKYQYFNWNSMWIKLNSKSIIILLKKFIIKYL